MSLLERIRKLSWGQRLFQESKIARIFLADRILYISSILLIIVIFIILMELELVFYRGYVHPATRNYFVLLALTVLMISLLIPYMRQRKFNMELLDLFASPMDINNALLFQYAKTKEQRLINDVMQQMHTAYLNQLGEHRRKAERNHHFVLQWVHHMKTPVSIIDLLVQEQVKEADIESIREENQRISDGLELMLYHARLEKFALDLRVEEVAVHEVIRKMINMRKKQFIQYNIFPQLEGELWVETDAKWFPFLIQQLISNAIKYSKLKPNNKRLLITCKSYREYDQTIGEIIITDEGIGIAEHELPRIFDCFFTGENGRLVEESTGMGLYLSKLIVDKLGHTIKVQSTVGEGTTFVITCRSSGIHHFSE